MRDVVPARWAMAIGLAAVAVTDPDAIACADRYEASLHAHAIGGAASAGDPAAARAAWTVLGGAGVRASYARSNRWQLDAQVSALAGGAAAFARGHFTFDGEPVDAPFAVSTRLARLDLGATARFGVRIVPTVRLAAGVQARWRGAPVVHLPGGDRADADGRAAGVLIEPVAIASAGIDVRLDEHLVVGAAVGGSVVLGAGAFGGSGGGGAGGGGAGGGGAGGAGGDASASGAWRTIEATAHVAYYWYPLWID